MTGILILLRCLSAAQPDNQVLALWQIILLVIAAVASLVLISSSK